MLLWMPDAGILTGCQTPLSLTHTHTQIHRYTDTHAMGGAESGGGCYLFICSWIAIIIIEIIKSDCLIGSDSM